MGARVSARAEVLRSLHRAKLAAKKLHGRRTPGVSHPHWNEAALLIDRALPNLARAAELLERPRDRALGGVR